MTVRHILLMALACGTLPGPALAQPVQNDSQGRLTYDAAFFAQFSPANALQMIQRVPGFTLEAGSTEVRGFALAAGNVVINGQRPSAKSDSLDTILSRIPANRVKRIEIVSGAAFGADYVGKPQVANLILDEAGGLAGTIEARATREYTGRVLPKGSAALVWRRGASTFNAALSYQLYNGANEEGHDRVVALPGGAESEYRIKRTRNTEPYTVASLGWGIEQARNRSAHLAAKASFDKWMIRDTSRIFTGSAETGGELYTENHLWHTQELSGDVTRPLAGGAIKLNALATHRHRRNDDDYGASEAMMSAGGFYQDFDDYRDERVGRLAWSRSGLAGWTAEIGAEGAYNRLKTDLNLFNVAATGMLASLDLPIDHATVSERRGEGFVNAGRPLAGNLRLDLGLNFELSRLKVAGDVSARRTLRYWKPRGSLDWTPGKWHVQLSAKRTVAQLQFEDFVSGASFQTNQIDGGNAELRPQRKWELLLTLDRKILGDGRIKLDLGYNRVSEVQDRVPLREIDPVSGLLVNTGLDAPGNLGKGTEKIVRLNLDLPLSRFGVRGGRLSLYGSYVDSSVRDPYTFDHRRFTGSAPFAYTVTFRQDLKRFAWGVEAKGNTGATYYRLAETDNIRNISPRVTGFVEYRPDRRTTATLGIDNLTDSVSRRYRTFYAPDRSTLAPYLQEYRERNPHVLIYISVKHSFG